MNESSRQDNMSLLITDAQDVYVPQSFVKGFDYKDWGVSEEDYATLSAGPDDEWYWETWEDVLNYASFEDEFGHIWSLYQEGDLWAIRDGFNPDDENEDDGVYYEDGDENIEAAELDYLKEE